MKLARIGNFMSTVIEISGVKNNNFANGKTFLAVPSGMKGQEAQEKVRIALQRTRKKNPEFLDLDELMTILYPKGFRVVEAFLTED